ncbi:MAG TPA: ComEA family DNA-binding protein, partial [Pseudonocardiaceae bacterium]|nr:ComEA family DNA-binding protein [Pseudonocardiaceae bacterium]
MGPEAKAPPNQAEQATDRPDTRAGRLVERWLPGGTKTTDGLKSLTSRHKLGVAVVAIALLTAIGTAVILAAQQPAAEPAPLLAAAVNAGPSTPTQGPLVISVVGKVTKPGLVTLTNGARVADAIQAAGGLLPGTDDTALNLARRLADGEQIYVGVPVPANIQPTDTDPTATATAPAPAARKGRKQDTATDPANKINLNTATADQLQNLPGIGPTMAQRILTWRAQHGRFDSISQLREVGGIG